MAAFLGMSAASTTPTSSLADIFGSEQAYL